VVAVDYVGSNASIGQPLKPLPEPQLRPQAAVLAVIDVAGHQQKINAFLEAELDDVIEGFERCLQQKSVYLRFGLTKANEGAI